MSTHPTTTTQDAATREKEFFDRLLKEGIEPHVQEIVRIWGYQDVAILFWQVGTQAVQGARSLGWTGGDSEVRRMSQRQAENMAVNLNRTHPHDAAIAWLRRRGPVGRLFVFNGSGTLCLNYDGDSCAWSIEPGTLGITSN